MGWTRRGALAGGLAATLAPALASAGPAWSQKPKPAPGKIIIAKSGHVLAPVTMSGTTCYALLDNTQLTAFSVDAPGLRAQAKRDLQRAGRKNETYLPLRTPVWQDVGNARIQVTAAVRGLSTYTKANGVPVEMIMGANVFDATVVELDFLAGTIDFAPVQGFADPAGAVVFESKSKIPGRFEIPIRLGTEVQGTAIVSLGYAGIVRVSHPKVGEWINDGRPVGASSATTVFGSISTKEEQVTFLSPQLDVGPYHLGQVQAIADPSQYDDAIAVLGVTALRPFRVWLDGSRGRIWLTPNTS